MATCEVCGNDYELAFEVRAAGATHVFDSFECAVQKMAPVCDNCGCRIMGHGLQSDGQFYCWARVSGVPGASDGAVGDEDERGAAMPAPTNLLHSLPPEVRDRLMQLGERVTFAAGERIFEEGDRTERFWIIRTGSVTLDVHVPGRRAAVVETLGPGDLLGWSWLFPPYTAQLGAQALSPVRAVEFDAPRVRELCETDAAFGHALTLRVAQIIGHRLQVARTRLLDLYGPYG